jgi:hypothetical protein
VAILLGRPPGPIPELGEASGKEGVLPRIDRAILQDVPANLLLRRPDIRAAEFQIAAQSAQIGVAKADLYPSVTLVGSIGWSATSLPGTQNGLLLVGGPSLRWNIFDYGRIHNNVRVQDARLQQLILTYQNDVRVAAREADDAASGLLKALEREEILREAAYSAERSLTLANTLFKEVLRLPARARCPAGVVRPAGCLSGQSQQRRWLSDRPLQGPWRWLVQRAAVGRPSHPRPDAAAYRLGRPAGRAAAHAADIQ